MTGGCSVGRLASHARRLIGHGEDPRWEISQQFQVNQDLPVVWDAFQDIAPVAQCLPGVTLTAQKSANSYAGVVAVKLGPMTPTFEGQARHRRPGDA